MSPPPEHYVSLCEEIKEAHETSSGKWVFFKKSCSILSETICVTTLILVMLSIHLCMIVVGMQAVGHCSAEKLIPIWMIVGGLLGLVIDIMWTVNRIVDYRCTYLRDEDDNYIRSCKCFVLCIVWFFLALGWFIAGNVWVYRIYAPQTSDVESSFYCEALVYYLAFWIITVFYICVCLTLIVCTFNCAYPGFTKCFSKK